METTAVQGEETINSNNKEGDTGAYAQEWVNIQYMESSVSTDSKVFKSSGLAQLEPLIWTHECHFLTRKQPDEHHFRTD